ncbi:RNA methyltransferase [Defluviimonas sp. 20V17]|uniref:N6-adenine-specific DNA methylase n=1 Tax=Allgaiera indica TaxID=765699 RepID=A0AAN4UR39_9RHOB|nr:RNA methyltransferase [Allgaiera indica]KDB03054.1 RNA methyltransferase [Defluviimonas sp. 20V17]GHE00785.1 RNA methyltransferase [Allgaiera indica]SDW70749.1 putative N6-adenine-specific DNA methylase [Allgaiera indica]
MDSEFDIFLAAPPGLEQTLRDEAAEAGFATPRAVPGGVETRGDWPEVWRANLVLRGAGRVLVRLGGFRAFHLAQLDKRAHRFAFADYLPRDTAVKVEATCRRSKIYHAGAAAQRVEKALADTIGARKPAADTDEDGDTESLRLLVRIDDDLVTFSLDTSGAPLHRRGFKEAVGKAPMRETLAALLLRQCGYRGQEPVLDPMCGSGTFPIEAAEIALGLPPGRARRFAFETLPAFDPAAWAALKSATLPRGTDLRFLGFDRDAGAIRMSQENAARAGVAGITRFAQGAISDLTRPEGPPGLVIINPPYGARIGNKGPLYGLHARLGEVLRAQFAGWRVGIVTSERSLAQATGLPFLPPGPPVAHGGLKVTLWQTGALPG